MIPLEDRVCLDESGVNCVMINAYGRSREGQRAVGTRTRKRGRNTTMAGVITGTGDFYVDTLRGAMKGTTFLGCMAARVVSMLRPGQVVIMDNPRIHHLDGVRRDIADW